MGAVYRASQTGASAACFEADDMVKWFRKLDPNYSQRMNDVLRIYWSALVGGQITAFVGYNPMSRMSQEKNALNKRMTELNAETGIT